MEDKTTLIRFGGVDFSKRIKGYLKAKSTAKKKGTDPDFEEIIDVKGYIFQDRMKAYYFKKKQYVFDYSDLVGDDMKDASCAVEREGEDLDFFKNVYQKHYGVHIVNEEAINKLFEKWQSCNIFYMSGHHYGDNFDHKYFAPGYATSCESYENAVWGTGKSLIVDPAFDVNMLADHPMQNIKIVLLMGCNYLRANMFSLYQKAFPNAVILGYHHRAPIGTKDDDLLFRFMDGFDWSLLKNEGTPREEIINAWVKAIKKSRRLRSQPGYYTKGQDGEWNGCYFVSSNGKPVSRELEKAEEEPERRILRFTYSDKASVEIPKSFTINSDISKLYLTDMELKMLR